MNIYEIDPRVVLTLTDSYNGYCYGNDHFSSDYEYDMLMSYWSDKIEVIDMFISGAPYNEFCEYSFILEDSYTGKHYMTKCERSCSYTHYNTRFPHDSFKLIPVQIKEKIVKYWAEIK